MLASTFLTFWHRNLQQIRSELASKLDAPSRSKGWFSSPEEIARVKEDYQGMLEKPEFLELTQYRTTGSSIPWKEEDYLKFLKGLA